MRYLVAEGAVGSEGRRVRCAHCGHQWFQEPEEDLDATLFGGDDHDHGPFNATLSADVDDMPFEDGALTDDVDPDAFPSDDFQSILQKELEEAPIPEGVKPVHIHEDITFPPPVEKKSATKIPPARLGGYATAAIVWVLVLGVLVFMQPQISRLWPPSNLFYGMIGLKPVPPGEGLSLDELRAEIGAGEIRLAGDIINLRDKEARVPAVVASIVDVDGKEIDKILIAPPVARLKGEGRVSFDATYPKIPDGATNVNYAFTFVKVKAEKEKMEDLPHDPSSPPTELKPEDNAEPEAPQHPAPHH